MKNKEVIQIDKKVLAGGKLAGGNPENGRVEFDYYATNPKAVEMLLTNYTFDASTILEPCVGGGHIADTINKFYTNKREITGLDIVDRGYPNTIVQDFLSWETDEKFEGKKIFEGDIVVVYARGYHTICTVSWAETVAHFQLWQINTIPKTSTNLNLGNYDCEIIGNIHDNPELLKGDAE